MNELLLGAVNVFMASIVIFMIMLIRKSRETRASLLELRTLLEGANSNLCIYCEQDISEQEKQHYRDHVASNSEFDARIKRFQDELNTPTYAANVAQTYHPGVENIPHESVSDVAQHYEPEYAD